MRAVIIGAGAIGGTLAAQLHESGIDVVLVARGRHGKMIAQDGLRYLRPHVSTVHRIPIVAQISLLNPRPDDIAFLAVKLTDSVAALESLSSTAPNMPIVCMQNGVAGEQMAKARFPIVLGALVYIAASYLQDGMISNFGSNRPGTILLGAIQGDESSEHSSRVQRALSRAGFDASIQHPIMPWKYSKLLTNLCNAIEVVCSDRADRNVLAELTVNEGREVLVASNTPFHEIGDIIAISDLKMGTIAGQPRRGGSMSQSVARSREIEVDYLNGAIIDIAQSIAVHTPINRFLRDAAHEASRSSRRWTTKEVLEAIGR